MIMTNDEVLQEYLKAQSPFNTFRVLVMLEAATKIRSKLGVN